MDKEQASQLYRALEAAKRTNGDEYVRLAAGSPEWMTEAVRFAHDDAGMLPDDWRYALIERAAGIISDSEDDDYSEGIDQAVDVYTGQLNAWLASNVTRVGYVDDAIGEFGIDTSRDGRGIMGAIAMGQYAEIAEIVSALVRFDVSVPA